MDFAFIEDCALAEWKEKVVWVKIFTGFLTTFLINFL